MYTWLIAEYVVVDEFVVSASSEASSTVGGGGTSSCDSPTTSTSSCKVSTLGMVGHQPTIVLYVIVAALQRSTLLKIK
jgi:hypothetical protein